MRVRIAMTAGTGYFLRFVLAASFCMPLPAFPQNAEASAPARDADFTFTISKVIGQPGGEVSLQVLFARKPGTPDVASIRASVSYPPGALQYQRIEDAYLSRRVELKVEAGQSQATASASVLEMEFRLPDPKKYEFPSGHIATIYFDISGEAPDQMIHFNPEVWIDGVQVKPDDSKTIIEPGEVRVSKDPVLVGCFFFTH